MTTAQYVITKITADMVNRQKEQIGKPREREYQEWEMAGARTTRSQIRHWAVMIGDMRPLFLDLEYAQKSPWGTIIAPPGLLLDQELFDPEVDGLPGCNRPPGCARGASAP